MPDLIQFDCPSCAATLRVPLEMAGLRGPCPLCQQDIIAPNPYTGVGPHLPFPDPEPLPPAPPAAEPDFAGFAEAADEDPPPPSPEVPEPTTAAAGSHGKPAHPFADKLIEPQPETDPEPAYQRIEAAKTAFETDGGPASHGDDSPPKHGRTGLLVFGFLVTALIALAAGFFIGNKLRPDPSKEPLIVPKKPVAQPAAPDPPVPPPLIPPAAPPPEVTPPKEKPPEQSNKTSLENAQATLRAFLEAPDWAARSAYVLSPDTVRPKMEAYAKNNPDGPTPFKSFKVADSQVDADSGTTLLIFQVDSPAAPGGIPVAILETSKGWLVDWESFVEFRDDQFKEFADGPSDHVGEFHLIVTAPDPSAGAHQENETFASFIVRPPLPDRQKTAFIKKSNPAYEQLKTATIGNAMFAPVLKITKAMTKDGRSYLEILSIEATDWRPRGGLPPNP